MDGYADGAPCRLSFDGEVWVLELSRLMRVFGHVYRPVVQKLRGAENILSQLGRSAETRTLHEAARALLAAEPEAHEPEDPEELPLYFEACEGAWQRSPRGADVEYPPAPTRWGPAAAVARTPRALRPRHVAALLSLHDELREADTNELPASVPPRRRWSVPPEQSSLGHGFGGVDGLSEFEPPPVHRAPIAMEPLGEPAPEYVRGENSDAPRRQPPLADELAEAPEPQAHAGETRELPESQAHAGETRESPGLAEEPPALAIASSAALRDTLGTLLGDELPIEERRGPAGPDDRLFDFDGAYACLVQGANEQVVGALVADGLAVVALGARFLGQADVGPLLEPALGPPSDDRVAAVEEIFLALARTLDWGERDTGLELLAIGPLAAGSQPWMAEARERTELTLHEFGTLLLVAR